MSHFKKSLVSAFLLIALCVSLFLLAACDKGGSDTPTPKPDDQTKTDYGIDNVYFMTEGDDEYLFTITGNAFMLSGLNGDQSGTFTYEDGVLTLTFKGGGQYHCLRQDRRRRPDAYIQRKHLQNASAQ